MVVGARDARRDIGGCDVGASPHHGVRSTHSVSPPSAPDLASGVLTGGASLAHRVLSSHSATTPSAPPGEPGSDPQLPAGNPPDCDPEDTMRSLEPWD
jgi:hypothetical protein